MKKCINCGKGHSVKLSGYCLEEYRKYKFDKTDNGKGEINGRESKSEQ